MHFRILRSTTADVDSYIQKVEKDADFSMPTENALRCMSSLIDTSAQRAFNAAREILKQEKKIQDSVVTLRNGPRTCGGFTPQKAILKDLTPFEQMTAFDLWFDQAGRLSKQVRTIALGNANDDVVPIWVKPPRNGSVSLMTTLIGNTRGALKAPAYTSWAAEDPANTHQKIFIEPLNCLEMIRQPHCIGSLLLKSNSYDGGVISNDWRYAVMDGNAYAREASVELPGQKTSPVVKIKEQSAGYNLAMMLQDDVIQESNLLSEALYEDYHDVGYDDDALPEVTPRSILKSLPKAMKGDTEDLDDQISMLFATRMGISEMPVVKSFTAKQLFKID